MRNARLLGAILVILTGLGGGLLLASPAGAQPPFRLPDQVTDNANVLSPSARAAVTSADDKLYADRHIRLWVVYVESFSGQGPENWARRTRSESDLGDYDALLAVSTTDRAYAFFVPSAVKGVNPGQVDRLRRTKIEPALHNGDWGGAAVAAADGLNAPAPTSGRVILLLALGVIAVVAAILVVATRYRRRRRRAAALAAARQVDPTDATALAAVPVEALDDLSRSMVVEVDNAVRTSVNELTLAIDEFGNERTQPFTQAVDSAKSTLSQAFNVRHQLDDSTPETPAERRELLIRVIVSAAHADRELESQREAFDKLRDLVLNASSRLDAFTEQYVELTSRIAPAEQRLAELGNEFEAAALASVSGNIAGAKERLAFADRNIGSARALAPVVQRGQQSGLVDAIRAAESALGQAAALLDAIDNAAGDIKHAVAALPSVIDDIQANVKRADEQLQKTRSTASGHIAELKAAREAAIGAIAKSHGGLADPLGAFSRLTKADADLNRILAAMAQEQVDAEQLSRSLEQALFTAESRVRGVSDYIDTRRGSIGAEARTRLAEAQRHLEAAQGKKSAQPTEAIAHANAASTLAANAQALANADIQRAQRAYASRGGGDTGAMIGGLIINDLIRGGIRGGFGGWSPTSFGGSPRSAGHSSDGGLMGGAGRF
jgi:predicted  nucleic acid-binding Zn-ribbon protein